MIIELIMLLIFIGLAVLFAKFISVVGRPLIKIILHLVLGWITLAIVNLIPGINIPINLLTLIISGFGGIFGTILLLIISLF
ncbi:MAG: pro-sigmaK processing inhibitor BofA family protein [Methanobacteriaceae archaeon]|nr:pro-sigmaK processing inhibitor BofA family protein [Methanobacteriaceae archaeon]